MSQTEENQGKPNSDELVAILGELSTDQIRFVIARNEYSSDKETAEAIGVKPATVYDWRFKGVPIDEAVGLMVADGLVVALQLRRRNLAKAMAVKVAGLDSGKETTRQHVATEIVEWELGKAPQEQKVDVTSGGKQLSSTPGAETVAAALEILDAKRSRDGGEGSQL